MVCCGDTIKPGVGGDVQKLKAAFMGVQVFYQRDLLRKPVISPAGMAGDYGEPCHG
jgi:hypothetical protein